ncbi:hypothetical protein EAY39_15330 [Vibrio anguillarum]|uniref:hypothetical protein n=3 Tax=Vibrio anguillarum TaxID=55601 RepID=UPI0018C2E19C|nr:hypothetical protein [Vibrio anguillarum]MBF4342136.1 hypothetical protein [Vibrio anguillarum]
MHHELQYIKYQKQCNKNGIQPTPYREWLATGSLEDIMEISTSTVTIKELKLEGSKLTKAKVLNLALIEHIPALKSLMKGSLTFLAKYPIQTYCKAVESVSKTTGTQLELPPEVELVQHFSSQNNLCGAILYDPQNKRLLNTWFTDTNYVTPKIKKLRDELNALTTAYNTVSQQGEPEIYRIAKDLRSLGHIVQDTNLYHYIEICQSARIDEWEKWEDEVEMTAEESQQWYDDGDIIGIKGDSTNDFEDTYIRRNEQWSSCPGGALNPEWVGKTLKAPSHNLTTWVDTKQWILDILNEERGEIEARLEEEEMTYHSVKLAFSKTPFIEIF